MDPNDSQLSSVTPSQSASQIALAMTPDDSPARPPKPRGTSSLPPPTHVAHQQEREPEPDFALEIGPAHSIDDHGLIHESVPSSRIVDKPALKVTRGKNSDENVPKMSLEVHENDPFGNRKPARNAGTMKVTHEGSNRTLKRPPPLDAKTQGPPRVGFPRMGSGSQNKHASDLGPRSNYDSPPQSPQDGAFSRQGTISRKRSTSFSLLGGLQGMFRGKKRSSSAERNYLPTSTGGWHTRTDKNLSHSRRGRSSSSEDDLPSALMRKSRANEQTGDNSSVTGVTKRLTKRMSTQSSKNKVSPTQETSQGPKYTVIERAPREELVRRGSSSSKRSANISTESGREMARETAANTAVNSGTTSSRRASMPPERPLWDNGSQGETMRNRLQHDNGTAGLNTLENRTAELAKLSERLQRLEQTDALTRTADTTLSMTLPPPKLEVVKAPPSITQAPLLFYPTESTSYRETKSASPRVSTFNSSVETTRATDGAPARRPARQGSLDSYPPPNGGANLKPRTSTSSKEAPLKSALKSPNRAAASLPPLPSILANTHKRSHTLAGDTFEFPDRSGQISPPTPAGARDGLKPNGDSLFVSASAASSPPTTSSILVPTPRRLSEIPASTRSSMAIIEDDESIYESAEEEPSIPGEDSDRTNTPPVATASALTNILGRLQDEEPRSNTSARSTPVSTGEGSHEGSSTSTAQRRKSVRMIIYPTVAVSPPERYADEPPTPKAEDPPSSLSPTNTSASSSTIRPVGVSAIGGWETRIDSTKNAWDDSSEEDEEYGMAKRALARASEPLASEKKARRV